MNYANVLFLGVFPAFMLAYWLLPSHAVRLALLLAGSLAFYASGGPGGVPVLLAVAATAYVAGVAMVRWDGRANTIAALAVAALVAGLALFKYAAFINDQVPRGGPLLPVPAVPLGISFFTFVAIAYVVDVKRGMIDAERSPSMLAVFVGLFPHLSAGPISRADDVLERLRRPVAFDLGRFTDGLQLFIEGLVKKRLIADPVAGVADAMFADPASLATGGAWIGLAAYTVQIYADFSGYTDMVRGVARMLGLELPRNFDAPYVAHSITDFWQRWHITLSTWLRDYVWVPLGGLRRGRFRRYYAVFLTMLIGGIWHGAGWTFAAWGAYQGAWLALERRVAWSDRMPRWAACVATLFIVMNGWVLFRSASLADARAMFAALYLPTDGRTPPLDAVVHTSLAFTVVLAVMTVRRARPGRLERMRVPRPALGVAYGLATVAAVVLAPAPAPFIYFRF